MSFILATDSSANLTDEMIEKYALEILPLSYLVDGIEHVSYVKGVKTDLPSFYKSMREGAKVSTSCVNVETASEFFERFLSAGNEVLYIGFSSALSATCANAETAAANLRNKYPDRKIYVVDSLAASMGQGLLVTYAATEKEQGKSIEEVRDFTEALKLKVCHQFTVDDLMFLKRGGRISGGTALIGTILKIKPVMHVDNLGRLIPKGKVIGRKASIKALYNKYVEKAYDKEKQLVYISHGDCPDDAKLLADMIRESGCKSIEINYVDQVIGAHSGPGTLALFFLGNDREA
jgi:DegV family protein